MTITSKQRTQMRKLEFSTAAGKQGERARLPRQFSLEEQDERHEIVQGLVWTPCLERIFQPRRQWAGNWTWSGRRRRLLTLLKWGGPEQRHPLIRRDNWYVFSDHNGSILTAAAHTQRVQGFFISNHPFSSCFPFQ